MLFLLAAWIVLLAVSVPTGMAILRWAGGAAVFDRPGDRLVLSIWLGVLALANVLLVATFLLALTPLVGAVVGVGLAAAALAWSAVRDEINLLRSRVNPRLVAAFLALTAGVAIFTAQPVLHIDTGYYQAGAIRWLSEFGAVEGIALVQEQLGFASSWFALAAPFNPDGLRDHAMAVMGGFAALVLAVHVVICVSRALLQAARPSDWLVITGSPLIVALPTVQTWVSASTDIPVNVLILLTGWAILTVATSSEDSAPHPASPGPAAVPLVLALGAMTIKPHAGPLVVVAGLFYILTGGFRLRRALWATALAVVVVAPWLAYEFVTTGCPAYPLPVCADVGWSVGAEAAREASANVQGPGGSERGSGPAWWIGTWLTDDLTSGLGGLAVASTLALGGGLLFASRGPVRSAIRAAGSWVAIAGALGLLLFFLRSREIFVVTLVCASLFSLPGRHRGTGWLLALGLAGLALTVYAAPLQPRFTVGYTAVLFARLAILQGPRIWMLLRPNLPAPTPVPRLRLATLLVAAAVAAAVGPLLRPTSYGQSELDRLGWRVPPKRPASVSVKASQGIRYRVPDRPLEGGFRPPSARSGQCWAAELPCTAYWIDPNVDLRDVVLRDEDQGVAAGFTRSSGG